MTTFARVLLLAAVMIPCVGCDQATKGMAARELKGRSPVSFLGETVRLTYAENAGGFLSLGAELPRPVRTGIFIVCMSLFVLGMFGFALAGRTLGWAQVLAMGLLAAGGVGNLVDRIARGYARDFIFLRMGTVHTGVFNVADIAITLGVALLLIRSWTVRTRAPAPAAE